MRVYSVICILTLAVCSLMHPFTASAEDLAAQAHMNSYKFAATRQVSIVKTDLGAGVVMDMADSFLNNFRGKKGIMFFVACAVIAFLGFTYGYPHVGLASAVIATAVLLINRPSMGFLAAAGVIFMARSMIRQSREAKAHAHAHSLKLKRKAAAAAQRENGEPSAEIQELVENAAAASSENAVQSNAA